MPDSFLVNVVCSLWYVGLRCSVVFCHKILKKVMLVKKTNVELHCR